MYSCVIFDVDGTIIDTESVVLESYKKTYYHEFKKEIPPDDLKAAYGVPTSTAMVNLGFKDTRAAEEVYHNFLVEEYGKAGAFKGILPVLEALERNNIVKGIVTSRNRREVDFDPYLMEMIKYFQYIVSMDDTEKHKPEPEPLLKLLEMAGCDASEALYIGDTYFDYLCAKAAGVDFALAMWGANDIDEIKAKYVLSKPSEILEICGFKI